LFFFALVVPCIAKKMSHKPGSAAHHAVIHTRERIEYWQ